MFIYLFLKNMDQSRGQGPHQILLNYIKFQICLPPYNYFWNFIYLFFSIFFFYLFSPTWPSSFFSFLVSFSLFFFLTEHHHLLHSLFPLATFFPGALPSSASFFSFLSWCQLPFPVEKSPTSSSCSRRALVYWFFLFGNSFPATIKCCHYLTWTPNWPEVPPAPAKTSHCHEEKIATPFPSIG